MIAILILALNNNTVAFDLEILGIADVGQSQMLGDLRADLSRIAIDSLTAGDDEIVFQVLDCGGDRRGRGPRIGAAERAVGDKNRLVGPMETIVTCAPY